MIKRTAFRILAAAFLCTVAGELAARADTLDDIIKDWTKHREKIRRVAIVSQGTSTDAKGFCNEAARHLLDSAPSGDLPPRDHTSDRRFELLLDLERNWAKKEVRSESLLLGKNVYQPNHEVKFFVGDEFQQWRPDKAGSENEPELRVRDTARMGGVFFDNADWAPFIALVALPVPNPRALSPERLRRPLQRQHFRPQGTATLEGREHVVLHTVAAREDPRHFWEFWVDRSRDSMISRAVLHGSDIQIDLRYKQSMHGWLLDGWKWVWSDKGKLLRWADMRVTKLEVNPAFVESQFRVQPKAGMIVSEERSGRRYVKGGPGQPDRDLDDVVFSADRGADATWIGV